MSKKYHKINSVFKRDDSKQHKIIEGEFSVPEIEYLKNNIWEFYEKIDGTNIRITFIKNKIIFNGKTDEASIPPKLLYNLNNIFMPQLNKFNEKFIEKQEDENREIVLYGEGYGKGIQKIGKYYGDDQKFILFDVKIGNWWLNKSDVKDIADYFSIDVVPLIGEGTINDMVSIVRNGFISTFGDFYAEGIVANPKIQLFTRSGVRIITKLKHKDFL